MWGVFDAYGYPDLLQIDVKNGENIYISYAHKCDVRKNADSTEYICKPIDGYLRYSQGEETKLLQSKQLFDWLQSLGEERTEILLRHLK
ncbi:MAG: hypothetical protein K0Q73_9075 [Paenibacillus sp.]|jgi:hypothetical protein|nr:hypothetical protein [Paenibacillus sp.]